MVIHIGTLEYLQTWILFVRAYLHIWYIYETKIKTRGQLMQKVEHAAK